MANTPGFKNLFQSESRAPQIAPANNYVIGASGRD